MSFQEELENIVINVALNGAYEDAGQRQLSRTAVNNALTSIINLVDKEVIGEDERIDHAREKIGSVLVERNVLRAAQRAIIRSNT